MTVPEIPDAAFRDAVLAATDEHGHRWYYHRDEYLALRDDRDGAAFLKDAAEARINRLEREVEELRAEREMAREQAKASQAEAKECVSWARKTEREFAEYADALRALDETTEFFASLYEMPTLSTDEDLWSPYEAARDRARALLAERGQTRS